MCASGVSYYKVVLVLPLPTSILQNIHLYQCGILYIGSKVTYESLKNTNALDAPPVSGWQYLGLDSEWHYDSKIKIERLTNASICLTVKIRKGLLEKISVGWG